MTRNGNEASMATFLLVQRAFDVGTEALRPKEFWELVEAVGDVGALLAGGAETKLATWVAPADLKERIRGRLDSARQVAFERESLETKGVRIVTVFDDTYPHRYRERLKRPPALLYALGRLDSASSGGVAIVGSRDVTKEGAAVARDAARWAAQMQLSTISGGAKGVDRLAMDAALEAGSDVVGVLPAGLMSTARDASVRRAIHNDHLLLLSPNSPNAGFTAGAAMGRNKLIYALADVALVVASDLETGGTWAGAKEALRESLAPICVWTGPGAGNGNEALAGLGARRVSDVTQLAEALPSGVNDDPKSDFGSGRLFD